VFRRLGTGLAAVLASSLVSGEAAAAQRQTRSRHTCAAHSHPRTIGQKYKYRLSWWCIFVSAVSVQTFAGGQSQRSGVARRAARPASAAPPAQIRLKLICAVDLRGRSARLMAGESEGSGDGAESPAPLDTLNPSDQQRMKATEIASSPEVDRKLGCRGSSAGRSVSSCMTVHNPLFDWSPRRGHSSSPTASPTQHRSCTPPHRPLALAEALDGADLHLSPREQLQAHSARTVSPWNAANPATRFQLSLVRQS
jgi:hypothetical protein